MYIYVCMYVRMYCIMHDYTSVMIACIHVHGIIMYMYIANHVDNTGLQIK